MTVLKVLRSSVTYKLIVGIIAWFSRQYRESRIISAFLKPTKGERSAESSIFTKLFKAVHRACCFVFEKLRLEKVFDGSITKRSFVWCAIAVTLAPIVPTMVLAALAILAFLSLFIVFSSSRGAELSYSPINRFVFLYAFVYIAATMTSVTVSGSLKIGLITVLFILFSVVLQNAVKTRRQFDALIYLLAAAGTLVAAYGCYQYVFGASGAAAWIDSDMFSSISTRVYSTLGNPNVLSEYLLLIIPFTFALFFVQKRPWKKFLLLCAAGGMCLCMLLTFSRGGWLGLIFAAAVFLIVLDGRYVFLGIAALIVLYFVLPETVISRFTSIGDLGDGSTSYRVSIWYGTVSMLKDYWMCGIGPGTEAFNLVYPIYSYSAASAQHAHNLFLQITAEAGVCGILAFAAVIFTYFRTTLSAMFREKEKSSRYFQAASAASVAGFLVQGMTDNAFYNYRVLFLFWAILAVGMLAARRSSMPEAEE